jgi:hypothetical protein
LFNRSRTCSAIQYEFVADFENNIGEPYIIPYYQIQIASYAMLPQTSIYVSSSFSGHGGWIEGDRTGVVALRLRPLVWHTPDQSWRCST